VQLLIFVNVSVNARPRFPIASSVRIVFVSEPINAHIERGQYLSQSCKLRLDA
jgi:hypothetical protein